MQQRQRSRQHIHTVLHQQTGLGMFEVLVTLVITTVGLLGIASLQFVSSLHNADALARSQAVLVAEQFAERLRSAAKWSATRYGMVVDNAYFTASNYHFADLNCADKRQTDYTCFCLTIPAQIPDCERQVCSASQIAQYDAYQLSCTAVQSHPLTEIALTCTDKDNSDANTCSVGSPHNILVKWPIYAWQNQYIAVDSACQSTTEQAFSCVAMTLYL